MRDSDDRGSLHLHHRVSRAARLDDERELRGGLRVDEQPVGGRLAHGHLLERGRLRGLAHEREPTMRTYVHSPAETQNSTVLYYTFYQYTLYSFSVTLSRYILFEFGYLQFFLFHSVIVDCSGSTIAGAYTYTAPSPATLGDTMSVTCNAGYSWNVSPFSGAQSATCANVGSTGQWVIPGGAICVGIFAAFIPKCYVQ